MTWTQPAFAAVAELVSQRAGLSFANRQDGAELGMRRAMARAKIHDPLQYRDRIATDNIALDDLLNELTVGETYFFREPGHFQFVQQRIIPEILKARGDRHTIRAWSAACATGEEAYSLAILFERSGLAQPAQLMATDISRAALTKARLALYTDWSLRGDGAVDALSSLLQIGKNYQLAEKIRQRVTFSALNLALDTYPSFGVGIWGMDLILCRNVLIYFDKETVRRTAQRLYQTLADGGWLITASSDPPLWDYAPFTVVAGTDGLFYRRPNALGPVPSAEPETPTATIAYEPYPDIENLPNASDNRLDEAKRALAQGDFSRVVRLSGQGLEDVANAILRVRAMANLDPITAEQICAQATGQHPLSAELHYLHAVLLLDRDRTEEAARAMRRVIYLDRSLAMAHFTLGAILRRSGDGAGAGRAYRNAHKLCAAKPVDEPVPLADGEPAGRLAEIAAAELALLELKE